ncbi:hypothetical protein BU16DRAFT_378058 [Lophium mytilinum]|uniref:Uncharacterized protein n=1 Tax=Lophium mytilinum TaxID=390894 RepID=A0A6A6QW80_9PEZI|nr:hypothetical protein BU16DRAFT_378058 [Lophium mytilinum]
MASHKYTPITLTTPLLNPTPKPTSTPIKIDPSAPGTIGRIALAIEAAVKITVAFFLTFFPHLNFGPAVTDSSNLAPSTIALSQWIGVILIASAIQHALAIRNTRSALDSRHQVYWRMLVGEALLASMFLYQALTDSGIKRKVLLVMAAFCVDSILWRLFCLVLKPEWFGRHLKAGAESGEEVEDPLGDTLWMMEVKLKRFRTQTIHRAPSPCSSTYASHHV